MTAIQLALRSQSTARVGVLGLAAAAGVFGLAAMMSAATAPTACADDFTDIVNAVDSDFAARQADFSDALSAFGSSDADEGLAYFFSGVDDDFVSAPDNLFVGTVDLLTNEPVTSSLEIDIPPESDFTSALNYAEIVFANGEADLSTAATALLSGDYADAAYQDALGSIGELGALQILLDGAAPSF
jgi:hypothetical protein